jgi:hypothetical protein
MFLESLAKSELFSAVPWHPRGRTRTDAVGRVIDVANVDAHLTQNGDDASKLLEDLGYSFSAWNEQEAGLHISCGAWTRSPGLHYPNHCVLSLTLSIDMTFESLVHTLKTMVHIFQPHHAGIHHQEMLSEFQRSPFEVAGLSILVSELPPADNLYETEALDAKNLVSLRVKNPVPEYRECKSSLLEMHKRLQQKVGLKPLAV